MEDLGAVQRSQKEKKLQIPKPDTCDGSINANPTYQRWYETINDYLYHSRGTWDGDSDLIRVVGAYVKGKARDWYDNRARQLRANGKIDSWPAFVSAMDERFKTSHEDDAAFAEMATVVYQGSVMSYIDKLVKLNEKAKYPVALSEACLLRASRMSSERIWLRCREENLKRTMP